MSYSQSLTLKKFILSIPVLSQFLKQKKVLQLIKLMKMCLREPVSFKRKLNYFLLGYSSIFGLSKSLGKPVRITIEPTNVCDQKCPICETGNGELGRSKAFLNLHQFKYILDQFDETLEHIFFYFMGEPLLNKDAYKMINHAAKKGIYVSTCTDGNFVNPKELVDSGIAEISFQIGGMTQETHQVYRVGGYLHKALTSLEETIRLRNLPDSKNKKMRIKLGFILMKHNEHEVEAFKEYCHKVGVDAYDIIGTCLRKVEEWEVYMPSDKAYWSYDYDEYKKGRLVPIHRPDNFCGELYSATSFHVSGDVVPCCRDPKGLYKLGNIFEQDFYKTIWNNQKYQNLRNNIATRSNTFKLCTLCPGEGISALNKNALMLQEH